jgi:hypothetical protein
VGGRHAGTFSSIDKQEVELDLRFAAHLNGVSDLEYGEPSPASPSPRLDLILQPAISQPPVDLPASAPHAHAPQSTVTPLDLALA